MNWKSFVKEFVSEIDYDIGKQLDPETAEMPDKAENDLVELVETAKRLAKEFLEI